MSDSIQDFIEYLESCFVIFGILLIVFQIRQQTKIAQAEHDRQKKQSTIEFYNSNSEKIHHLSDNIGEAPLTLSAITSDKILEKHIRRYLAFWEHFAVGIASDVYDFEIFNLMMGVTISNKYKQLKGYIENLRILDEDAKWYSELELLTEKIDRERKANPRIIVNDHTRVLRP